MKTRSIFYPRRLILAPLRGLTPYPWRRLFQKRFGGFDLAVAPFIPTLSSHRITDKVLTDILPENNRELPVIPQLIGNVPGDFIRMSRRMADFGYKEVNWNLGCPFPMVAKKKRGSGLLCHPDLVDEFLDLACRQSPCRISVKIRLGRHSADELDELLPILNRYPLSEVILHPRTGVQMYGGQADTDAFARAVDGCRHPLVYNGDIFRPEDFIRLSKRFPSVRAWMIGRGALIDPFLPSTVAAGAHPSPNDALERFIAYHDELVELWSDRLDGPGHLLERMKNYWQYFVFSFRNGRRIAKKIHRAETLDAYRNLTEFFFEKKAEWRPEPIS